MKVVIVGGVAGGATCAARIRRLDENAQITVYERTGYVSYANCGLPYYVGGVIEDEEELTLQSPEGFWNRYRIRVFTSHEVTAIDAKNHRVTVWDLTDGTQKEDTYDKLVLAPGARAVKPDLPGIGDERIFTLKTVEDTFRLSGFLEKHKPEDAVVVGGGYIGLEIAENLKARGLNVCVMELADQVIAPLDPDMAGIVQGYLRKKGIDLRLKTKITGFERGEKEITVLTDSGRKSTGLVVMSAGVAPENALAVAAGLQTGVRGTILVDAHMRTSDPDIYAAGDAVQVKEFVSGDPAMIALAGPANKQARIAADNICGVETEYGGAQGSSVIRLFDITAAATGISEKTAAWKKIPCESVVLISSSHAGYYPGAKSMYVKVLFQPQSGDLLGAQIVGFDGVDKRIDVIATAIRCGMKAAALAEIDLCYAPPYSSAKDPVNMAGYVIGNVMAGHVRQYHWQDVAGLPRDGSVTLLDVRTDGEYAAGHIEGTLHIPVDELRDRIGELDPSKKVYINCQSGLRSYLANRILAQKGFDCYNLAGGYGFYSAVMKERAALEEAPYPCGAERN